jgi:phytoene dehydrogenase-like protein
MTDRFRKLSQDSFDAVVIGSGPGGLTAGALLAAEGRKVLVLDQHYEAGGNMTTFRRKRYEFDVGVHYLGGCHDSGFIPRILRAAGASDVAFEPMDPDGFDTLVFPDFTFKVPRGIDAYRDRLIETFPEERAGILRYTAMLRQIQTMQSTLGRPLSLFTAIPKSLMLLWWSGATFEQFMDSCTKNPRLRAVMAGQHANYALPPSRASVLAGVGIALHYVETGGYFPRGGGQAIADALAASIERNGGKVLLRTRAKKILVEKGRATGVVIESKHLGQRTVRAPIVVSNADLKRTMLDLVGPEHLKKKTVTRTRGFEMAPALGMVYLSIKRDLRAESFPRTNFWIHPSYDVESVYAANERGQLADPPVVYVSIGSVKDPTNERLAPAGETNLQLMSLAPSRPEAWGVTEEDVWSGAYQENVGYRARKADYAERLIRATERAIPGLKDAIVYKEVATPLTQQRYTWSTGGTSYGIASTPSQFLGGRPDAKTDVAGLFLCGASCRMGHGIAGAVLSGMMAAAHVVGSKLVSGVMSPANAWAAPQLAAETAPYAAVKVG